MRGAITCAGSSDSVCMFPSVEAGVLESSRGLLSLLTCLVAGMKASVRLSLG